MTKWSWLMIGGLLVLANVRAEALFGSSSGNESLKHETESSVAKKIKKGKTTKKEVKSLYGSPLTTSFTDGGLEIWTYHFYQQHENAMNYVPYANKVESGNKGVRKELRVVFNDDGVVKNYSMNESKTETHSGLFK